jgi:hypothetical protein
MRILVFNMLFIFLFFQQHIIAEKVPTAQELAQKSIDYRKKLESGKVVARVDYYDTLMGQKREGKFCFIGYFKKESIRNDRVYIDHVVDNEQKKSMEQKVVTPSCGIHKPRFEDEVGVLREWKSGENPDYQFMIQANLIGAYARPFLSYQASTYDLEYLCPSAAVDFQVSQDRLEGKDMWKITRPFL